MTFAHVADCPSNLMLTAQCTLHLVGTCSSSTYKKIITAVRANYSILDKWTNQLEEAVHAQP